MRFYFTFIFPIAMFLTETAFAQKKSVGFEWSLPGRLTAQPGMVKALGVAGAISGISNNMLIVAGGANFPEAMPWEGGKKKYHDQITVFGKNEDQLHPITRIFRLPSPVAYAATCTTPRGILYAGGENENGILDQVYLLNWDSTKKTTSTVVFPPLPIALTNAAAVYINNRFIVLGGEGVEGVSDRCWSLDLNNIAAGWLDLPPLPQPVSFPVCVSLETEKGIKIYVLGGRRKSRDGISDLYNSVYAYDLSLASWSSLKPLPYPLSAGSGVAYGNNSILLFSGDQGATFTKVEQLLAAIPSSQDETERAMLVAKKNELLIRHPGFSKTVILYNVESGESNPFDTIPFEPPVTTNAFWWDGEIYIPSGEIRPGVRTPQIIKATLRTGVKPRIQQ
jgi:N-acetylneuraminate epimerase